MYSPGKISAVLFFPVCCPEIPKASLGRFFFQWGNVLFSHVVEFTNWTYFSLSSVLQDALSHAESLGSQLSIAWVWNPLPVSQHRLLSGTRFCNSFWLVLPWRYFLHAGVFKNAGLCHFGNDVLTFFYHFAIVIHPFKHVTSLDKSVRTLKCWLLESMKNDAFIITPEYAQNLASLSRGTLSSTGNTLTCHAWLSWTHLQGLCIK